MGSPVLSPIVGFTEIDPNVLMPTQQANQAMLDIEQATLGELDCAIADADFTLTTDQAKHWTFVLTGTITANRNFIVPSIKRPYDVKNSTTPSGGSWTVTVKAASGTGVALAAGDERIVRFDGANVVTVAGGTSGGGASIPPTVVTSGATFGPLVRGTHSTVLIDKGSGSATTVYLSDPPQDGDEFTVKDAKGDAATHNITVQAPADVTPSIATIDGSATFVIDLAYGGATFIYSAVAGGWFTK